MPVIALVEGTVWGGACEIALTCDITIATPSASFAFTPARLGVPYNTSGILNMMKSIGLPLLKEMLFTARPIPAGRALELGMINAIAAADESWLSPARGRTDRRDIALVCRTLQGRAPRPLRVSSPESGDFRTTPGLRRAVYDSEDYQEGIRSFLEKRKTAFKGK